MDRRSGTVNLDQMAAQSNELATMQDQFPDYLLWRELGRDRMLFYSRSRSLDINPRIVITHDLNELRDVLLRAQETQATQRAASPPP
jgi:hypothetical protein